MAYNPYTAADINSFIDQKGIANDPWAMYNFRQQYNVDPAALDAARGWGAGTSQGFMDQAQKTLAGPIAGTRDLGSTNPHMAYALAQQRGNTAGQADSMYGLGAGTSAGWAQQQGLTGLGAPAGGNPYLQIGGTPTPANNSPASPYSGGMGASTGGSTPATMQTTSTGSGATGVPSYMVSPNSGQQRNPYMQPAGPVRGNATGTMTPAGDGGYYMSQVDDLWNNRGPAGGRGSNYGGDPRMGGPGQWGQGGGMGGLMRYFSENPHMLAMGNEISRGVNDNLQRNIMPGIRGNAMGSGTVGGSRQGVAEGLATGESMKGLAGALANLYGNQFNQDRGYGLQSDALDFQVHRGNLQDMRQGQMDQLGFLDQMQRWNQGGIGAATQVRDQPFTDWNRFVGPASQMAGLGGQQSQNLQGNPWLGALGGYMAGSKAFGG